MRHLLSLALMLNAAPALSAAFHGRLPLAPLSSLSPLARLPIMPLTGLPGVSLPAPHGGVNLPGKLPPLPAQLPVEVAPAVTAVALPAEAAAGFFLRWDLLDGPDEGLAPALIPVDPGPKPLPPAGAMRELELAGDAPFELFDAARRQSLLAR